MQTTLNCKQAECPVRDSGKCLEGLEFEECSHFYFGDELLDEEDLSEDVISENVEALFHGDELPLSQLNTVTQKFNCNTIIIIGESESGKTTILGSIFDLFQIGTFQDFLYAGSLTQIGFEKRCHHSRSSSEGKTPQTEKTKTKDFNFLHISVKHKDSLDQPPKHLILSDISGERFQGARDSSSTMAELQLIKDADHLIFLLDGKKLADKFRRTGELSNAKMFIKRAIDVGIFGKETKLNIVVSKWDLLEDVETFNYQKQVVDAFTSLYKDLLLDLTFDHIAVRPIAGSKFVFGDGLNKLLNEWIIEKKSPVVLHEVTGTRYSERYKANYEE